MGKKNKKNVNEDHEFAQVQDDSKKFVSYKQQLQKEKEAANQGMPSKASQNLGVSSDSDNDQIGSKKKKQSKKDRKTSGQDEFLETSGAQKGVEDQGEGNFEGIGKKNTRKKKEKEQMKEVKQEDFMAMGEGSDSDDQIYMQSKKKQKNKPEKNQR